VPAAPKSFGFGTTIAPKVSSAITPANSEIPRTVDFIEFFAIRAFGIAKAKGEVVGTKQSTKRKVIMKLIQCERPGLVGLGFGRLTNLQDELDRLFETQLTGWLPALDVQEDKDSFTVRVELPGLKREEIQVALQDGALTISGERKTETASEGVEVHRSERCYGKFQRVLTLPASVPADQVKAAYKDGILTVTLPKAEEVKPKQIDVSVN
jgi:HSP20 family protein